MVEVLGCVSGVVACEGDAGEGAEDEDADGDGGKV